MMGQRVTIINYLNSNLRMLNHSESGISLPIWADIPQLLMKNHELMPNSASQ